MGVQALAILLLSLHASSADDETGRLVRVEVTLRHETVSGFTDKKQEAFLAAFAVVSNLGPVDMTSLELKGVQRAKDSGVVVSIEMRSDVENLPNILKKLSQRDLDSSLATFVEERPGGVEIATPEVTDYTEEDLEEGSSGFGKIAELEAADWLVIIIAVGALLIYQKVQNTRALEALKRRRNRRHSNLPEGVNTRSNAKVLDSRVQSAQDDSDDDEHFDSYLAGLRRAQEGGSEVRRRSAGGV
jgi:hypothetical protein